MNNYDHEDAFKDANLYAGAKTKLPDALKFVHTKDQARVIIGDAQDKYLEIFDAFIAGVDYGRRHPMKMND